MATVETLPRGWKRFHRAGGEPWGEARRRAGAASWARSSSPSSPRWPSHRQRRRASTDRTGTCTSRRRTSGPSARYIELRLRRQHEDAALIRAMIETPQAVWFTQGTPRSVHARRPRDDGPGRRPPDGARARRLQHPVPRLRPVLGRRGDDARAEYEAWIDGFAAGIGNRPAIVILEPDGLGIIPWYDPYGSADGSNALEWCQPAEADPATAAAERFAMLDYAVDALAALPNVTTYLDGTHSAWLGAGDIAHRLAQAGVADADGFYLNVSNYHFTTNNVQYGTVDLELPGLRHGGRRRRLLRLPEPVLERGSAAGQDRPAARRVDRRRPQRASASGAPTATTRPSTRPASTCATATCCRARRRRRTS